jgi:hypothetical protein
MLIDDATGNDLQVAVETDVLEEPGEDSQHLLFLHRQCFEDREIGSELAADGSPHDDTQTVLQIAVDGERSPICDTDACARQPRIRTRKQTTVYPNRSRRTKKPREYIVSLDVNVLETYLTEEEQKC